MSQDSDSLSNYKIPMNVASDTVQNMTSVVDMAYMNASYDPNMVQCQPHMMQMWNYQYQNMMQPIAQTSSPVISAPPALNANGIKRKIDKDIQSELNDPSLPKELTALFQPLFCKLCTVHLNSNSNATLHYQSKNHAKKVRKFLIDYSERTGEPLHKKALVTNKHTTVDDPKYTYCSTCDLHLTSKLHAEQHYMGKNHQREKPKPDTTGGRFGIGMAFVKPEELPPQQSTDSKLSTNSKFLCDLCKVATTSAEHLQMHMNGQKHKKLLKKSGLGQVTPVIDDGFGDLGPDEVPEDNILNSVISNDIEKKDYSVYRTPSGWYYCESCNQALNSEHQFVQHLASKKHLKKKTVPAQK